jgi:hypothetical protein
MFSCADPGMGDFRGGVLCPRIRSAAARNPSRRWQGANWPAATCETYQIGEVTVSVHITLAGAAVSLGWGTGRKEESLCRTEPSFALPQLQF